MKIRTVYIIHHSHTDIGYTHGQSRIVRWHGQYIRQAMDILEKRSDFAWTCETFYPVEEFFHGASPADRERFIALCHVGKLGLTAGYLNFTELADRPLLDALAQRARSFADLHGIPLTTAIIADVNGCPLIHARALAASGVQLLMMCVHPHHGYIPLGKREALFRWDLGDGQHLLVCHADHYHVGNELGLAPGAESNYTAGFSDTPLPMDDEVLERRLPAYLKRVEDSGWAHDHLVLAVSGLITDNAPPSEAIADRIARWNKAHCDQVRIQMISLNSLAAVLVRTDAEPAYPVHCGDWPDWWADGAASDPEGVALVRHTQRERRWLVALAAVNPAFDIELGALDKSIALFAEHTFGHSASVSEPWNLLAQQLRLRKLGFAAEAADRAEVLVDWVSEKMGGGAQLYDRPPHFRVVQPFAGRLRDLVELEIEGADAIRWGLSADHLRVVRTDTQAVLPHQTVPSMRGIKVLVDVIADQGESFDLAIESVHSASVSRLPLQLLLPDKTYDVVGNCSSVLPDALQTSHLILEWSRPSGITRWSDAGTGRDLLDHAAGIAPFSILASRLPTPAGGDPCTVRRNLGRNRNGREAIWSRSQFKGVTAFRQGEHLDGVELEYQLDGCEFLRLRLNAWKNAPRVDAEIVMLKVGTWDAEQLYLALPFSAGNESQLWLDRGTPIRPWRDQLPGTLADYAGVQAGLAWCAPTYGVAVAQKDSHLIQLGPLEYGIRRLSDTAGQPVQPACTFAWLMTNYWETNFSPELGGFYSFRFSVLWGEDLHEATAALGACQMANSGVRAIRLGAVRK